MTKSPEFSVFSDRTVNCSTTIVEKIVEKPLFVEKIVEKPLNVESKQGWRHFWTVFFANKNTRYNCTFDYWPILFCAYCL